MNVPGKNSGSCRQHLPRTLKEQLKQQAKANRRSLNSEILARLEGNDEGLHPGS